MNRIHDRKIRIAVIGCGRIAENHFNAIEQQNQRVELVAVCETDKNRLNTVTDQYGIQGFANLSDLLEHADADLVTLCTPSGFHSAQVIQCAHAGVHVMTEKPMATRWKDGVRMVRACDEAGVQLFVVKQNRRNTTLQLLKKAINQKRFGRIYMVHVHK